ncbi:hypothetical protein BpHYR1_028036 [Brachionus plicatilis]|uniref:Uncharacterized protein n=1 Tax=Brachionus plicatilis TaxID=10195 RepID=A0A3M7P8W3_BRAPC|nr:hypothetical protein BpHYR1_028036 [Brachionus plicatilis]
MFFGHNACIIIRSVGQRLDFKNIQIPKATSSKSTAARLPLVTLRYNANKAANAQSEIENESPETAANVEPTKKDRGGRKKGSKNKKTLEKEAREREASERK